MAHCLIVLTKQECDVSHVLNYPRDLLFYYRNGRQLSPWLVLTDP